MISKDKQSGFSFGNKSMQLGTNSFKHQKPGSSLLAEKLNAKMAKQEVINEFPDLIRKDIGFIK